MEKPVQLYPPIPYKGILVITFWIFAIILVLKYFVWDRQVSVQQGCTAEAMICPDGTAVGRTGPNCTFAPCLGK